MAFNVSVFRASLVNDGARPSLFEVILPFPTGIFGGIGGGITTATADLSFKCRATSLPGDSISSISIPYFGREIKEIGRAHV